MPEGHAIPEDRLTRFSGRAASYARARPSYPPEAIDAILEGLAPPGCLVAADVGAGTGIAATLLAERGVVVRAVEPNADMRAAAAPHERVEWIDGTGERTTLDDRSIELIVCAQSFHWMAPDPTLREFARILRAGGRLAFLWNTHDRSDSFTADYTAAIERHATGAITSPSHTSSHERALAVLKGAPGFRDARARSFPNTQTLTRDALIERAASSSYCPNAGYAFEAMAGDLAALFERYATGGDDEPTVTMRYQTHVHLADRSE